jgi:hypothetical protein
VRATSSRVKNGLVSNRRTSSVAFRAELTTNPSSPSADVNTSASVASSSTARCGRAVRDREHSGRVQQRPGHLVRDPDHQRGQQAEVDERTGADLRWLDAAFAVATLPTIKAVVIQSQADMWDPEKGATHLAAYEPFIKNVANHTKALGKPVLMLNGDSHVFLSDNPLTPTNAMHPGYDVPNFHRIVVHGSTAPLEWLRLTIDPKARAVARMPSAPSAGRGSSPRSELREQATQASYASKLRKQATQASYASKLRKQATQGRWARCPLCRGRRPCSHW